jgi:hypothetical protein
LRVYLLYGIMAAMSEWIDVNECVKLSGKSIATVRRAIRRLPDDAIKKEGSKHLYDRAVILHELGSDSAPDSIMSVSTIEHDTVNDRANDTPLIEALKGQIQAQSEQLKVKDEQIAQLLERQRETNILINNLRLLTAKEPIAPVATTGKSEAEVRRDTIFMYVALAIVLVILGLIVWASWRWV